MALGGILATALNTGAAHPWGLFMDGVDVIAQPGTGGSRVGVELSTIKVTEQGPNGVSAMTYTIDDPLLSVTVADGMRVRFHDFTRDRPEFVGFVESWRPRVWGVGRQIDVTCVGLETLLDWIKVPALTFAATLQLFSAVASLLANAIHAGHELRASTDITLVTGSQQDPVSLMSIYPGWQLSTNVTVAAGTTLREAIRQVGNQSAPSAISRTAFAAVPQVTVDFYNGLRVWPSNQAQYGGGASLVVTDTYASALRAESPDFASDAASIVRAVYVIGGNAAGSGVVPDGSGLPGDTAVINDSTILTAADRDTAAFAYLTDHRLSTRGGFDLLSYAPSTNVVAGASVTLTDVQLGVSAQYDIGQIVKRYTDAGQDWRVQFGGRPVSVTTLIRRLTRTVLS